MNRWLFGLALSGLFVSVLSSSFPAPQQAVQLPKPLQHEVSVVLKLIQVYVTDKDGKPVLDLTKDDFILMDDGKAQILTEFEKHVFSLPSAEAPAGEKLAATPLPEKSQLLSRKVFLFFDFGHSSPEAVIKVREAALHFLATGLMPADQVAMVSYAELTRLKIHEWLTSEQAKVRKLVEGIGLHDSLGSLEDKEEVYRREKEGAELRRLEFEGFADASDGRVANMSSAFSGGGAKPQVKQSAAWIQSRTYINRLAALAQALRYEPGRKIIVLFSSGIAETLLKKDHALRRDYEELCAQLATSNAVVYPIDMAPPSATSLGEMSPSTLIRMASVTGGRFMGNVFNYTEHFKKLQTLTAYYYVLGYSVDEQWDGRYRKIKVSVRRPGCEVHTQAGYFNPKSYSDYTAIEKRMHLVDLALSDRPIGQVPFRFPIAALAASSDPENNLFWTAEIPAAKIRERTGTKAEVTSLVFDEKDEVVFEKRSEVDFAAMASGTAFVFSRASAPPGLYRCRIVIRNPETGAAAVAGATTFVPLKKEKGLQLFPPLFLKPDRGARYIKELLPKAPAGRAPEAAIEEAFLFDPAQYVPRLDKTFPKNTEAWAAFRCAFAGGQKRDIKLTAFFYDLQTRSQIPVPLTIIAAKERTGFKSFFAGFKIPEMESDQYRFCLVAEDSASGEKAMTVVDLIVK